MPFVANGFLMNNCQSHGLVVSAVALRARGPRSSTSSLTMFSLFGYYAVGKNSAHSNLKMGTVEPRGRVCASHPVTQGLILSVLKFVDVAEIY